MNFDGVSELFLFINVIDSSQNVVAEQLLVQLCEISLELGNERD